MLILNNIWFTYNDVTINNKEAYSHGKHQAIFFYCKYLKYPTPGEKKNGIVRTTTWLLHIKQYALTAALLQ